MKNNQMLVITSLLSILLMTLHLTSDTIRARGGSPESGGSTLIGVPILALWLGGTLLLAEKRSGHIIMLIGSILAMGMPVIHVMFAAGIFHGNLPGSSGPYIFVWTLHMLGLIGIFSFILAVRGLWNLRRAQPR